MGVITKCIKSVIMRSSNKLTYISDTDAHKSVNESNGTDFMNIHEYQAKALLRFTGRRFPMAALY